MVRRYSDPWNNDPPFPQDPAFPQDDPFDRRGPRVSLRDAPLGKAPVYKDPLTTLWEKIFGTERIADADESTPYGKRYGTTQRNRPSRTGPNNRTLKGMMRGQQQVPDVGYQGGSFADYLAQAMGLVGGSGGGTNVADNRIQAAEASNAEANARIAAIYKALNQTIEGQVPLMRTEADAAMAATRENASQAQEGVEGAREASRAAEAQNLENIGIGDSALLAAGRERADTDMQSAVGRLQNNSAAQGDLINQMHGADVTQTLGLGRGSQLRGAELQVQNERALQNRLAALRDEQYAAAQEAANRGQQSRMQAIGLAQDMANQDYDRWRDQQGLEMQLDQTAYDRAMDQQRMQGGGMDTEEMRLILNNLPEGHPMRDILVSQLLGISPMMFQLMGQPQKQISGVGKGLKRSLF